MKNPTDTTLVHVFGEAGRSRCGLPHASSWFGVGAWMVALEEWGRSLAPEVSVCVFCARRPAQCPVCDGERVVALGEGAPTDLFDCPSCVGLRRSDLAGIYAATAEEICASEGVAVRWLDGTRVVAMRVIEGGKGRRS